MCHFNMEQKIEKIEGTRYVKIGDSIFNTISKSDSVSSKVICECLFCGERFGGDANGKCAVYCKNCRVKENRAEITRQNEEIRKANLTLENRKKITEENQKICNKLNKLSTIKS